MEEEMKMGDGGKVGETKSQRAACREDVSETKRRLEKHRCWQERKTKKC